jgi:glycosyltransferase involved in cell wall biosynthesis
MNILDDNRFTKLVGGKLVDGSESKHRKILYLKHPDWQEPENKEHGIGGINAVGRVIYNHIKVKKDIGYQVDMMWDSELTRENAKKYDFVHCSFWFQCFMCLRMGIPYILNIHDNSPLLEEKGSIFYDTYSRAIEQSLVTVSQTDQTREHWDHLAHKILTVPVPIDTDLLTIDDSIVREDYVLCAAGVQRIKGHHYLAKACNELKLKLLIIGNPDDEDEVRRLRFEIDNSEGRITWIDKAIPFNELIDYYRKCRVFAMTTLMDVPGLVYLEALSCGANVVATEQGDYKSENPKIARCTLDNESIKSALNQAWNMPHDTSGREYVVNKHHPKNAVSLYEKIVYNGGWSKDYSIEDMSTSLYDMDFSDETKVTFVHGFRPIEFDHDIDYEFDCGAWNDKDVIGYGITVFSTFSSANVRVNLDVKYTVKLDNVLVETGTRSANSISYDRIFHVDNFDFLNNATPTAVKPDVKDYVDHRIKGKMWDLYTDSIVRNGVSLELYSWPLVTKSFCSELIQKAELYGEWTTTRHENYPTHDILLKDFGYGDIWDSILFEYAYPVATHIWNLQGFDNMINESFIVKYDLESKDFQMDLALHHDHAVYTFVVGLNDDYEGGGTWFPRQNYLINRSIGQVTLHPSITHKHGARAVTSGIRYVLISFCNKG